MQFRPDSYFALIIARPDIPCNIGPESRCQTRKCSDNRTAHRTLPYSCSFICIEITAVCQIQKSIGHIPIQHSRHDPRPYIRDKRGYCRRTPDPYQACSGYRGTDTGSQCAKCKSAANSDPPVLCVKITSLYCRRYSIDSRPDTSTCQSCAHQSKR